MTLPALFCWTNSAAVQVEPEILYQQVDFLDYTVYSQSFKTDDLCGFISEANQNTPAESVTVSVPAGTAIERAWLFWVNNNNDRTVTLNTPSGPVTVNSERQFFDTGSLSASTPYYSFYQERAEVTSAVQNGGAGTYTVSGMNTPDSNECGTSGGDDNYSVGLGGWQLIVLVKDTNVSDAIGVTTAATFTLWESWRIVSTITGDVTTTADGFIVPLAGGTARVSLQAYEGDNSINNDNFSINWPAGGPYSTTVEYPGTNDFDGNGDTTRGVDSKDINTSVPSQLTAIDIVALTTQDLYILGSEIALVTTALPDYGDAPSSYRVTPAESGPLHLTNIYANQSWLGDIPPDSEFDPTPGSEADSDGADDDGLTNIPPFPLKVNSGSNQFEAGDTYTIPGISATNETAAAATLCGWIDFDIAGQGGDGTFEADEGVCTTIPADTAGDDSTAECTEDDTLDDTDGKFTCTLDWIAPADFVYVADEDTYARFRIEADPVDTMTVNDFDSGFFRDGEIEDYKVPANTLPVDLNSFSSSLNGYQLTAEWTTASETFNLGFSLWGKINGDWKHLGGPYLSEKSNTLTPTSYSKTVKLPKVGTIEEVGLSSIDLRGVDEFYGGFEPGVTYGVSELPEPIDWTAVRAEHDAAMIAAGYMKNPKGRWIKADSRNGINLINRTEALAADYPLAADIFVASDGMVEVTYEDLAAAGIDLRGVKSAYIAVTHKGKPVGRYVQNGSRKHSGGRNRFGPRGYIHFYGEAPKGKDKLYIAENGYRISVDYTAAIPAASIHPDPGSEETAGTYLETVVLEEENHYDFMSPADAWNMDLLRSTGRAVTSPEYQLHISDELVTEGEAVITITLGAMTDFPASGDTPDHSIEVRLNGQLVASDTFEGYGKWVIEQSVPANMLNAGMNSVQLRLPMDHGYPADIVQVDSIRIDYTRATVALNDLLEFDSTTLLPNRVTFNRKLTSYDTRGGLKAYASKDGNLARIPVKTKFNIARNEDNTAFSVTVPYAGEAIYSVGTRDSFASPTTILPAVNAAPAQPAAGNYLIIAHPSFLPSPDDSEHPLNRYIEAVAIQGYDAVTIDLLELYADYGWNMALPDAITNFLASLQGSGFEHVLLVGADTYDYLDREQKGALSFIPTVYTETSDYIQYTPADSLMTDIDDDGKPDFAIGRWPVRTMQELTTIVDKTIQWSVSGQDYAAKTVLVAEDDPGRQFATQLDNLAARRLQNWDVTKVYMDDIGGLSSTRTAMFDAINAGQSMTVFDGHGSTTDWGTNLFTYSMVGALSNEDAPTLVMPLACYTTYVNGTDTNSLGHQLLLGGAQGAVAIHGSATLSTLGDNNAMAEAVLKNQFSGMTLGKAVQEAKRLDHISGSAGKGWNLLGDPTIMLHDGQP